GPGVGAADRERADGVDVQGDDATDQGSGDALGWGQRREPHGPGSPGAKRSLEDLLGNPTLSPCLSLPKDLPHPERGCLLRGLRRGGSGRPATDAAGSSTGKTLLARCQSTYAARQVVACPASRPLLRHPRTRAGELFHVAAV